MIVEMRIYTAKPGRAADFLKLYETLALPLQNKYLGGLLGFYTSEIGTLNQIVHLWRYQSLADREQRRAALEADPAWVHYRAELRLIDAIDGQTSQILRPTAFSPGA